jgi:hypothetical protein
MSFVGLLDLRDLHTYRWSPLQLGRRLQALGLTAEGPAAQRWWPPDRLVVIAPALTPELVSRHGGWLSLAASVLLVLDFEGEAPDEEVRALLEEEWAPVMAGLGNVEAHFFCDPGPEGALAVALDRALDLGPSRRSVPARVEVPQRSWPAGPWLPVLGELDPEALAPRLCAPDWGPALALDDGLLSLLEEDPSPTTLPRLPVAASRDGRLRLTRDGMLSEDGHLAQGISRMGFPVGLDPVHPLATAGYRCTFEWYLVRDGALSQLCICAHAWPCGHAKKLWGYKNNRAVSVAVAPDASAYVSTFVHDAIVSSQVPMRWLHAGEVSVPDWPPDADQDPLRALFFCTGDIPWEPADPLTGDEDQRAFAPVVVLGPGSACRYAVDLGHPTYRIRGEHVAQLDEGGYGVYTEGHELVRRSEGRLLGGWFQLVTVLHEGHLWREDLATGERWRLGPADREIVYALAVPGTGNVVLVSDGAIRLV